MNSTQPRAGAGADLIVSDLDGDSDEPERFQDTLAADGFAPMPICIIGTVDDGQRRAEVYEEEAGSQNHAPRFLVRLIVPGECEHVFTLDDLPELLGHFERLTPLFAPLLRRGGPPHPRSRGSRQRNRP